MIDTTHAKTGKMINELSNEIEADCEMNEKSTNAFTDETNPLAGIPKPDLS